MSEQIAPLVIQHEPTGSASSIADWTPVLTVAAEAFVMVTSEMLPVGVLSQMAKALGVTGGAASILVFTPGIMAAIAAPLCAVLAQRVERKTLLLLIGLAIVMSNLLVSVAHSAPLAILGRLLLGACVGTFWAIAPSIGRRLVPAKDGNRATAIILAGISLGAVLGVPAGTAISHAVGWRIAFAIVAVATLLMVLGQAFLIPLLPAGQAIRPFQLLGVLQVRSARFALIATALVVAGHFAAYTFLEPYLKEVGGMHPAVVVWLLFAYGTAGAVGTMLAERAAAINVRVTYLLTTVALAFALFLASVWTGAPAAIVTSLVTVWGLLFGAVPVCIQLFLYEVAPLELDAFSATLVSVFQIALATGSWFGGRVVDGFGITSTFRLAGILSIMAAVMLAAVVKRASRS
ncbi:MFS transporter [Paraburkholderia sp. J7]|uniref:MFS transporter n=1 Tax=Paraburkholderia sp. J7 TaxID=2805438 RepID=UPI002AB7F2BF|nr:MFS transporter [Paraburkholderia sp. J7]